ncbi:MAG: flagellar capping protein [Lachnospiraceae bacterium]|nr:flagellar capping protein [Lachnospiraceae bacterium]
MATNIAALNTVYNHFMTTYAPEGTNSKYDTHKKSELRGVYSSIVKMNKDAPLFLLDTSPKTQEFAVSLKEGARSLKNVISSVTPEDNGDLLSQKTVSSSDESIVTASYIGDTNADAEAPSLDIEVKNLAQGQTNVGNFLPEEEMGLEPGSYSFDVNSRDTDYEFQFNIGEGDTNRTIQEKLARLITKSNIGIQASTISDGNGNMALKLVSDDSGLRDGADLQFRITDDKTSKTQGTVDYFGLSNVDTRPTNSNFILNGEERSTQSNTFTVDKTFEITLNGVSEEGKTTQVGLKTDVESLTDNISYLIEGYNSFINKAAAYLDSQPYSGRLVREMNSISSLYGKGLSDIGLNINEDGTIELDKDALSSTARSEDALQKFESIKSFTGTVLDKINKVALNPMDYTQKTIVAYKNPGHNFASPYVTSNYSGMMFSSYC